MLTYDFERAAEAFSPEQRFAFASLPKLGFNRVWDTLQDQGSPKKELKKLLPKSISSKKDSLVFHIKAKPEHDTQVEGKRTGSERTYSAKQLGTISLQSLKDAVNQDLLGKSAAQTTENKLSGINNVHGAFQKVPFPSHQSF